MSDGIAIDGLEEVMTLVKQDLTSALNAACMAIAEEALNVTRPYPDVRRKRQPFRSDAQRRGFFARLRSGAITVPYRRSGDALGRWAAPQPYGHGARTINTSPHARFTYSAQTQAAYHQGNWKTDQEGADAVERSGIAGRLVEDAIQKAFS